MTPADDAAGSGSAADAPRVDPILVVHDRYRDRAGEDAQVDAEIEVLERHGHTVDRCIVDNRSIGDGGRAKVRLAVETVWSTRGADRVRAAIERRRPAVVHVHNTFPLLSGSIYRVLRDARLPVVQSLHNYRRLCVSANLYRDGAICHDCVGRSVALPGVVHGCYRDSASQSALVAASVVAARVGGGMDEVVDLYLTPSEAARSLLMDGGLPADRIAVKANSVAPDPGSGPVGPRPARFLFAGRLAPEKGVATMLEAWGRVAASGAADATLRIAGIGDLGPAVSAAAATDPRILALGSLPHAEVLAEMRAARALVFPSEWHEPFGLGIVEAFASGTPVIAAAIGAPAELVDDGRTGLVCAPGDVADLARRMTWALDHPDEMAAMGVAARAAYEARYTAEHEYRRLVDAYRRAIDTPSMNDGMTTGQAKVEAT